MKALFILFLSVLTFSLQGQTANSSSNSNSDFVLSYRNLNVVNPSTYPSSVYKYYESKDGIIYSVGDTLTIGSPSTTDKMFKYIGEGKSFADNRLSGKQVVITKFSITGNKNIGFTVLLFTRKYTIRLESAFETHEVFSFDEVQREQLSN